MKICGVTDEAGVRAAVRAGADAIGLNLVPGTPRALALEEAVTLARFARELAPIGRPLQVVAITVDRTPDELREIGVALDADAIQLNGDEPTSIIGELDRPAWKVLHLPPEPDQPSDGSAAIGIDSQRGEAPSGAERAETDGAATAGSVLERARAFLAAGATRLLLDTSGGPHPGGTGRRADPALVAAIARELPVVLAGGLDPANVADALRGSAAVGVDVASGTEAPRVAGERPRKDPLRVALFAKRARAARTDRPNLPSRPTPVEPGLIEADANGRWGATREFGGRYVPETLMAALAQLELAYDALRHDPRFWSELRELLATFAGRPTPLYRADRLAERILQSRHRGHDRRQGAGVAPPVPEARGPRAHRRAQGQQRARPGTAHAPPRQVPRHRRDRRRPARGRDRDRLCAARAAVRRVHGRGGHRAPAAERAPDARAGRRGAAGDLRLVDPQGRHQRGDARLGHERPDDPLRPRIGDGPAPVPDDRA